MMSLNWKKSDVARSFYQADKDGDGNLDLEEYVSMFQEMGVNLTIEDARAAFLEKDRDGDGKLSLEEFLGKRSDIERAWNALDSDRNGFITEKEILQGARKFRKTLPKILTSDNGQYFIEKLNQRYNSMGLVNYPESRMKSTQPISFEDFSAVLKDIEREDLTWMDPDRSEISPRHSSTIRKPSLRRSLSGSGTGPRSESVSSITEPLSGNSNRPMSLASAPPKRTSTVSRKSKSIPSADISSRTHYSRYF